MLDFFTPSKSKSFAVSIQNGRTKGGESASSSSSYLSTNYTSNSNLDPPQLATVTLNSSTTSNHVTTPKWMRDDDDDDSKTNHSPLQQCSSSHYQYQYQPLPTPQTPPSPNSLQDTSTPPSHVGNGITRETCATMTTTTTPPTPPSAPFLTDNNQKPIQASHNDNNNNGSVKQFNNHQDASRNPTKRGSHETKQTQSKKRKITSSSEQLYLDFGQASFGSRTICPICNVLYVNGVPEDETNHAKICKEYAEGVSFPGWKNARIVYQSEHDTIVEVRPCDPPVHRRKVRQVKMIVDQEMGFAAASSSSSATTTSNLFSSSSSNHDSYVSGVVNGNRDNHDDTNLFGKTAFLYVRDKKVVGFCTVEIISQAFRLMPKKAASTQQHYYRATKPTRAMMGVHQIWCHRSHRKSSIATRLVDAARSKVVYGLMVPLDKVAFSSPTMDGVVFAQKYVESDTPLLYVCE